MVKLEIPKPWITQCRKFAEASVDSSQSTWRVNREKAITDIFTGKMGEVGAFIHLCELGQLPTPPDFTVYTARNKSFDADLFMGNYRVHCKTQSAESMEKYGVSWILQYGKRCDPLFKRRDSDDLFMGMALDGNEVTIFLRTLVNDLFECEAIGMPAIKWLEATKRAVYYDKIKEAPTKIKWAPIK